MEASGPAHDLVVNESEDGGDDVSQLTALEQYGAYDFAKDDVYLVRSAPYGLFTGQTALGPHNSVLCFELNKYAARARKHHCGRRSTRRTRQRSRGDPATDTRVLLQQVSERTQLLLHRYILCH